MTKNRIRNLFAIVLSALLVFGVMFAAVPLRVNAVADQMTVSVTGCSAGMIGDISVTVGTQTYHSTPGESSVTVQASSGTCTIDLSLEPGYTFTSASVGGNSQNPGAPFYNSVRFENVTVSSAVSVSVTGAGTDADYSNIVWTDDDPGWMGGDCFVDPATGTIELLEIKRGADVIWTPSTQANVDYLDVSPDTHFVQCKAGDIVTYKFIPAPGYQISGAMINGHTLSAQEGQSVFQVTASGLFHIDGAFTETSAQTSVSASGITAMTVSGAENAVASGNVAVSASSASNPSDNDLKSGMGSDSGDFISAVTTADITMTNIISKGGSGTFFSDPDNYWTNNMSNLSSPVDISLSVPNNLSNGETYGIVRYHNGTYLELDAEYNSSTGKLTFSTDGFSEYTVIKREGTPVTSSSSAVSSSPGSSSASSAPAEPDFGYTVGGNTVRSFEDVVNALSKGAPSSQATPGSDIFQVVLRRYEKIIPAEVFSALDKSGYSSLHVFVQSGTAIRFEEGSGQGSIDVTCDQTSGIGYKRISFRSKAELNAKAVLHTIVPVGVQKVTVYRVLDDGTKVKVCEIVPTAEGRLGFEIDRLGTYELNY